MAPEGQRSASDMRRRPAAEAGRLVQAKNFDAAVVFPPDFAKRLEAYRKAIHDDAAAKAGSRERGAGSGAGAKAGWHACSPALPGQA